MRNLVIIIISALVISTSCRKFLEEDPKSVVSPEIILNSVDGFDLTLVGAYSNLTGWGKVYSWNMFSLYESFVDFQYAPYATDFSSGYIPSSGYEVNQGWTNLYNIINSANQVLANIEIIKDDPNKDRIEGEAKFLRGWAYFNLVQFFGDIPLVLEPVTDPSHFQPSRTDQVIVYDQIVKDMRDAANMMKDAAPNRSRANKWVAKAFLAKIYLTMAGNPNYITTYDGENTNQLALNEAKDVIGSNRYSINIPYRDVFTTNNDIETIWELETPLISNVNAFSFLSQGLFTPTEEFINSFEANDIRGPRWGIRNSYEFNGRTVTFPLPTYIKLVDTVRYANGQSMETDIGINALRYADVLLMAAEADNEVNHGPSSDAYKWINSVRNRAEIGNLSGLNYDSFRDAVFYERRHELYGEGFSWWDMKRFNKWNLFNYVTREIRTAIDVHLNYFPIYNVEIINNPNITQNPGWSN